MERYLKKYIVQDLKKKMVFIGGPRQVGKTTFSLGLLKNGSEHHPAYLNWDFPDNQKDIIQGKIPSNQPLIIFDEIHKYKNWRNLVKGLYDKNKQLTSFLITGSARLDFYRRGGDSLQGRYHYYRLHPFSLMEVSNSPGTGDLDRLLKFGGFPEPFIEGDEIEFKRWQRERLSRVIKDDLLGLEQIKEVGQVELLSVLLQDKIGSLLSLNSLREDLNVSHESVDRWLMILENLYYCFRIAPFGHSKIKALKKEKKLYLWDWSICKKAGPKFENLVASNLLKYCHFLEDTQGEDMELRYIRDKEKREIDFVILKEGSPQFAVECKSGDQSVSKAIPYFSKRTEIPMFYQVHCGKRDFEKKEFRTRVLPFVNFVKEILKI